MFILVCIASQYKTVLYPAYLSTISACDPDLINATSINGYQKVGQFSVNVTENESENNSAFTTKTSLQVFVDQESPYYKRILKHEKCHETQFNEGRLFSCQIEILHYANEVEAYFAETHDFFNC